MNSVSIEIAEQEVNKWLDGRRVKPSKREKLKDSIENLVEGFQDGVLILDEEKNVITQNLDFPTESFKTLEFTPRINVGTLNSYLKGARSGDGDSRILAYVCALTGKPAASIGKMDLEDYNVAANIAVFFF